MKKSRGHRLAEPYSVSVQVFDDELESAVGLKLGLHHDAGAARVNKFETPTSGFYCLTSSLGTSGLKG